MHNLTVADVPTYYVLAGGVALLVHNDKSVTPIRLNAVKEAIAAIQAGTGTPRAGTANGYGADRWCTTRPGVGNERYRILANKWGDVGWADTQAGKYNKIMKVGKVTNGLPHHLPGFPC